MNGKKFTLIFTIASIIIVGAMVGALVAIVRMMSN